MNGFLKEVKLSVILIRDKSPVGLCTSLSFLTIRLGSRLPCQPLVDLQSQPRPRDFTMLSIHTNEQYFTLSTFPRYRMRR